MVDRFTLSRPRRPAGSRGRVPILFAAVLCAATLPAHRAAATSPPVLPTLVVHLAVTGGLQAQETLRTSDPRIGSCTEWGAAGRRYSVNFYSLTWIKERDHGRSPDGFVLDMYPYHRGVTLHLGSFSWLLLTVVAHHRVYAGDQTMARQFSLAVRVAPDGRSGRLVARHLPVGVATQGSPIDVSLSWSCATLGR